MSKNKSGAANRPALYNPTAACVLALLIAVVLVTRPPAWWRSLTETPGPLLSRFALRGALYPLRPPSLTVLCISRT